MPDIWTRLSLANRVALVTGAAGQIGKATTRSLAEAGAHVVVSDLSQEDCDLVADDLAGDGLSAIGMALDVTSEAGWESVVTATERRFGALHVLVSVAGILPAADVETETIDNFRRVMDVNAIGAWLGMKHCVRLMRAAGRGSIINVASINPFSGGFGRAIAYHASKGAMAGLTRNAAVRLAGDGIRVNSVHPGPIDTPMQWKERGSPIAERTLEKILLHRLGEPREVGDVVAFLASDAASFITGSYVFVDGGWLAV